MDRDCVKCFICIISIKPHNSSMSKVLLLFPFTDEKTKSEGVK